MSSIIKAHLNKYKWLASALDDTGCFTDSTIEKRPKFMRYIHVIYGEAMATNGKVVHILPTPELDDDVIYEASDKAKEIKAANESLKRIKG